MMDALAAVVALAVTTSTPGQSDEPPHEAPPSEAASDEDPTDQEEVEGEDEPRRLRTSPDRLTEKNPPPARTRERWRRGELEYDSDDPRVWLVRASEDTQALLERYGIAFHFDIALFYQYFSNTLPGQKDHVWSAPYQFFADWELFDSDSIGAGVIGTTVYGTFGLNFDPGDVTQTPATAFLGGANGAVYPDEFVLDELYWKQVLPEQEFVVMGGILDFTSWFDTNVVANDGFTQFFAASLQNNLAIPFPLVGGVGALMRWNPTENIYLLAGIADSDSNVPNRWFEDIRADSLYQMVELGLVVDFEGVGRGNYRFIPWHSSFRGSSGFGFAVSFDQQLWHEDVYGFFRFGFGDQDFTPLQVGTMVSGGIGLNRPFGRDEDLVAIGASWLEPTASAQALRNETVIEAFYRIELIPNLEITPEVQATINPSLLPSSETVWSGGLRLTLQF